MIILSCAEMKNTKIILCLAVIISLSISVLADAGVIVYSAKWCHFCVKLEQYLDEHHVKYEIADIDKSPATKQEAIDKSGQPGIPVLDWNGEIIIGFSTKQSGEIDRLIAGGAPVRGKFNTPAPRPVANPQRTPASNMPSQVYQHKNPSSPADTKITVYSAKWCHFCVKLEQYLDSKNVKYEIADIDSSPAIKQEAKDKSGQPGIPVLDWNGEIVIGFSNNQTGEIDRLISGGAPVKGKFNAPAIARAENSPQNFQANYMSGQVSYYKNLFSQAVKNANNPNAAAILDKLCDSHIAKSIYESTVTERFRKSIESSDSNSINQKVIRAARLIAGYRYCKALTAFRNAVQQNPAVGAYAQSALKDAVEQSMRIRLADSNSASFDRKVQTYLNNLWACVAFNQATRSPMLADFPDKLTLDTDPATIKAKKFLDNTLTFQRRKTAPKERDSLIAIN
jgi:glutaredoxin 3